MNIKNLFISVFLLSTAFYQAYAYLPDPGTKSTSTYTNITSDYGPRNVTQGSNPHNAIDYDIRVNQKAYAVEGGQIPGTNGIRINGANSFISFGNWKYYHIEYTHNSDNTFQVYPANTFTGVAAPVIIIRELQQGTTSLITVNVLSSITPSVNIVDPQTGTEISTTNQISQYDWIFTPNAASNHLDIRRSANSNQRNPLRDIAYNNANAPGLTDADVRFGRDNNGVFTALANNIVYNKTLTEVRVDVQDDKDLNEINYILMKGTRTIEDLWQVRYEGNIHSGSNDISVLGDEPAIQNAVAEKCYPVNVGATDCGLDYFKYHFYTRRRQGTERTANIQALTNEQAHYSDGAYDMRVRATDIRGTSTTVNVPIQIDNFRPFRQSIKIGTDYEDQWTFQSNQYQYSRITNNCISTATTSLPVEVTFSEPIRNTPTMSVSGGVGFLLPTSQHP